MNCGKKIYDNDQIECYIGDNKLPVVESCKYLGVILDDKNDGNKIVMDKFNDVRKSSFSLSLFGMKPIGLNQFVKSFIYNTYCLPKMTYSLGIFDVSKSTCIQKMNTSQNNMIRFLINIPYKTHI